MTIDTGDIEHSDSVAIGPYASASSATIHQHFPSVPEPPEPTIKEQIRSIRLAILSLNQLFVSDREARIPLQQEAALWRTHTQRWLIILTVLVLFVAVVQVVR